MKLLLEATKKNAKVDLVKIIQLDQYTKKH